MPLLKIRITPDSPWITPWQSDTISGMLCSAAADRFGKEWLVENIIDPAKAGAPPFVISDAFPGDLLPIPSSLRLNSWPRQDRKKIRKARWLHDAAFRRAQCGGQVQVDEFAPAGLFLDVDRLHNTLDRSSNTTLATGGLFPVTETFLDHGKPELINSNYLSIYMRVVPEFQEHLFALWTELAQRGYGADVSTGSGQFDIVSVFEPVPGMENLTDPDSVVILSTFQPASNDPTDGEWEAFAKYGKVGPQFGLENVFKRPLIMMRAGATLRCTDNRQFVGRAIPMDELLAEEPIAMLREQEIDLCHYAFGLALPYRSIPV